MVICIETGEDNVPFIRLGAHILRLDHEELDEDDKLRAETELQETPENVSLGLAKLKELLENEPNLNVPTEDQTYLIKYLRPCRFIAETAFKFIIRYYKFRVKHPQYDVTITPLSIRHVFDQEVFKILPTRTDTGSRIFIMNLGTKWNPKKVTLDDMFKAVMVSMEIAALEPKTQLSGVRVIMNFEGLSLVHFSQFSPSIAKMMTYWIQECVAVRLKGIHVINQPNIFSMLFAIFKPFLGERLRKMVYFHGTNKKTLSEHISPESLPKEYGGTADIPDFPGSLFSDMLFYYEHDFEGEATLNVPIEDENFLIKYLRPCQYNPETAFRALTKYYKFKIKNPKLGIKITPDIIRHVIDTEVYKILPTRDADGSRIVILQLGNKWDPKKVKVNDIFRTVIVFVEIGLLEPKTQLCGLKVILDLEGLSMVHFQSMSPFTAKLILKYIQKCVALKFNGFHIVNQPDIYKSFFALFKPFLAEKTRNVVYFHGTNKQSLLKYISTDSLPEAYGGTANMPDYPGKLLADMLFYYEDLFEVLNSYGYPKTKEPVKNN